MNSNILNTDQAASEFEALFPNRVVTDPVAVERLSKDFYWYSPILSRDLEKKRADFAVQPKTEEEVVAILARAHHSGLPVTVRGGGTGNYGQCVPLHGGVVLDMSGLDAILEINTETGVARCQPGLRLGALEEAARKVGWELRCYPSTFVKASVGGFLGGGSGGIGSITYGGLREPGNVLAITLLTLEAEPRRLRFTGTEVHDILHAWGTHGVMIEIELALGRKYDWAQIAAEWDDVEVCWDALESLAADDSIRKRLVTGFEPPIPSYFRPLKKYLSGEKATGFFEVENSQLAEVEERLRRSGATIALSLPETGERRSVLLSDYTWNHTTLWAIKADPALTYLQCGFTVPRHREQMKALKAKFGDDFQLHLEFVKGAGPGQMACGSIPIVRYSTEERLQEMIDTCHSLGLSVANPHTYLLDQGGRWKTADPVTNLKEKHDPLGLLNPGKLKGYPLPELLNSKD